MKVLIFFMETVFPKQVHGGSTTVLRDIALALGKRGDAVTIVCRERSDNKKIFKLHPNVTVMPVLRFKEIFPDAYFTPPYNISSAMEQVYSLGTENDVFINFDSNFIFNDVIDNSIPVINCLHDFVYSGALQGSFLFRRGVIIVHSQFVKESLLATVGRFLPDLSKRVKLIPIGIDAKLFRKTKPKKIYEYIPSWVCSKGPILLCPHRPEKGKGIYEVIIAVKNLKTRPNFRKVILLIPVGLDAEVSEEVKIFYKDLRKFIQEHALTENVIFHPWIPQNLMSEYYCLGDITLCLGNQVESFGNVALESTLCGTPAIITRVAAYRTVLPDWCVTKIDPGDTDEAAKQIFCLIKKGKDLKKQINYIKIAFSKDQMIKAYESIIDEKVINEPLKLTFPKIKRMTSTKFSLAPWCYVSSKGIYNDYLKTYRNGDYFASFIKVSPNVFSIDYAKRRGIALKQIYDELKNGYLVVSDKVIL